jgi:hypothetical protein
MITKLTKHDSHQVKIYQTQNTSQHSYCIRCVDCNKHIQWLGVDDANDLLDMGFELADKKYCVPESKCPWGYIDHGGWL